MKFFVFFCFSIISPLAFSAIDVSTVTTYLSTDVTDAIIAVGGALLVLSAVAMGFKWLKAMFFG